MTARLDGMDSISIIIPNYQSATKLGRIFLENSMRAFNDSIEKLKSSVKLINAELILVDNGSRDETVSILKEITQKLDSFDTIKIYILSENKGYAYACNYGARKSSGSVLIFSNNDVIPHIDSIVSLYNLLTTRSDSGILKPLIITINDLISSSDGYYRNLTKLIEPVKRYANIALEIPYATGEFVMMKREVYERVGGFDEDFLFYGEDIDLSLKIKLAGLKIYLVPSAIVLHQGGGTTGRERSSFFVYLSEKARLMVTRKYVPHWLILWLPFHTALALYYILSKKRFDYAYSMMKAYKEELNESLHIKTCGSLSEPCSREAGKVIRETLVKYVADSYRLLLSRVKD